MKTGIYEALDILPHNISDLLFISHMLNDIDEIRLRSNRPISVSACGRNMFLHHNGEINDSQTDVIYATNVDIEHTFKSAFSYSIHSFSKELACGYVTAKGGNRVGICGTAVLSANNVSLVETLKHISSINIRISREIIGCSQIIMDSCNFPCGILVIGPPSSGKTTLLRDLSRNIGNKYNVSLIDELNEISATYKNEASCDVGSLTDVFVGYPKSIGITTAVKVMSPKYLIVDEIGTEDDVKALDYALNSGVKIITAVHSDSLESVRTKPGINKLISLGAFEYAVILPPYSSSSHDYKVIRID